MTLWTLGLLLLLLLLSCIWKLTSRSWKKSIYYYYFIFENKVHGPEESRIIISILYLEMMSRTVERVGLSLFYLIFENKTMTLEKVGLLFSLLLSYFWKRGPRSWRKSDYYYYYYLTFKNKVHSSGEGRIIIIITLLYSETMSMVLDKVGLLLLSLLLSYIWNRGP